MPNDSRHEALAEAEPAIDPTAMHRLTQEMAELAGHVMAAVLQRQQQDPWPLGETRRPEELDARVGQTVTAAGLGTWYSVNNLLVLQINSDLTQERWFEYESVFQSLR